VVRIRSQLLVFFAAFASLAFVGCAPAADPDSVEVLASDPQRLKYLRARCRTEHTAVGDTLCARVAEATRRRFMEHGSMGRD